MLNKKCNQSVDFIQIVSIIHLISWSSNVVRRLLRCGLLRMNANKSDVMFVGTSVQLCAVKNVTSDVVAKACLHPTHELNSLGVDIDSWLTFAVRRVGNYHIWVLQHIRHLLTLDVVKTLACSIVGAYLNYCNSFLYGAPTSTVLKVQCVQNSWAQVVLQQLKRSHAELFLRILHWLPVNQGLLWLTYKTRAISTSRTLLVVPSTRTALASWAFSVCAPVVYEHYCYYY